MKAIVPLMVTGFTPDFPIPPAGTLISRRTLIVEGRSSVVSYYSEGKPYVLHEKRVHKGAPGKPDVDESVWILPVTTRPLTIKITAEVSKVEEVQLAVDVAPTARA